MSLLEGKWVNVYYETEKDAAEDVFQYADTETKYIAEKLGLTKNKTSIYTYMIIKEQCNKRNMVIIVHAYISVKNPDIHLWLTEGMALYLSNGEEFCKEYLEEMKIPTYEDTCTRNPIRFSNCGGYTFANTYIEYLESTYGWSKVLKLIETENYEQVFGKSSEEIYDEWVLYLNTY